METKTIVITGASRGVGLAIAKRFAKSKANIVILAKTTEPNSRLPGTIWSARDELLNLGAKEVLAIPCDVRDLNALQTAIERASEKFNTIDYLINNASSIYLMKSSEIPEKRFDLMYQIIVRAALFASQYALPFLKKSSNPHILNISPKIDLDPKWFKDHTAYTICKFSASMLTIGLSSEFKEYGIAVNSLWPATLLDTSAVRNLLGGDEAVKKSRKPEIMADAAYYILEQDSKTNTGNFYLDEDIINKMGLNVSDYSVTPNEKDLLKDLYV